MDPFWSKTSKLKKLECHIGSLDLSHWYILECHLIAQKLRHASGGCTCTQILRVLDLAKMESSRGIGSNFLISRGKTDFRQVRQSIICYVWLAQSVQYCTYCVLPLSSNPITLRTPFRFPSSDTTSAHVSPRAQARSTRPEAVAVRHRLPFFGERRPAYSFRGKWNRACQYLRWHV